MAYRAGRYGSCRYGEAWSTTSRPRSPNGTGARSRCAARRFPPTTADQHLLDSRGRADWKQKDAWRTLRILSEFVEGFDTLAELPPAVSVFGSARSKPGQRRV